MAEKMTTIGAGAHFKGKISNASTIEVSGIVEADVTTEKLTINETGKFGGSINSKLVVVSGSYDGNMVADSVWLMPSSRVSGEIKYKSLQLDRGAALNCRVIQNWDEKVTMDENVAENAEQKTADTNKQENSREKA